MDLFAQAAREDEERGAPLAARMRPRTLDELAGQEELVGPGAPLRRAILADRVPSMILWGPPGSGKTTLALIVAGATRAHFAQLNAVTAGVGDVRRVIEEARERRHHHGQRTILFIDEIHRFSKPQQDALLPAVEAGAVILIGATTENPYFSISPPLMSRARLFRLSALSDAHVEEIVRRALADTERFPAAGALDLEPEALAHLVSQANGDARTALNALEALAELVDANAGVRRIGREDVASVLQQRALRYDAAGDAHYDTISAFIKSLRGSDPDAAVYWLARMLEAGEDARFIARRLVVHAAEDVGNADPQALLVATAAARAVEYVGLPEARIPLAQATLYVATAPKSNAAYLAISRATEDVRNQRWDPVPPHLRDTAYRGARALGHGRGYQYPHDFPDRFVVQQYLPDNVSGRRYYEPADQGYESVIALRLAEWRKRAAAPAPAAADPSPARGSDQVPRPG